VTEPTEEAKTILARLDGLEKSVEGMRAQNSAEHGSLFTKLLHLTEVMHWLRDKWNKFTRAP
jgi:hypothetical protein